MIAFRDKRAEELGLDLIVHINQDGLARGINPFDHGSAVHTDVMKTEALKQASTNTSSTQPLVARAAMRRNHGRRNDHLLSQ